MKRKTILFPLALLAFAIQTQAQTYPYFNTSATIDIANIKASHQVHGDMWFDTSAGGSYLEFPKGSGQTLGVKSALWMSGYTPSTVLQTAAVTYRTRGGDFWPGPVDSISTTPAQLYASSQDWAKIWKINSSDIDAFLALATHTTANTPPAILEWPAKGNPYAKGAGGASLAITKDMAPFVDLKCRRPV
jgi:hypothetical protein